MISKMVSEPLQDPLGHLLSGFRYRATHTCYQVSAIRFCGVVLGPTTISKNSNYKRRSGAEYYQNKKHETMCSKRRTDAEK
ncbi:hypothetical protein MTR_8g467810 [Medicago truncatula]|uniref:Uncharacterized protein n=1 Tax=Medicago truncatula TaxID=3880 RepID=A0A072TSB5_MEDTR|nr:hypothetical protein MTR_8g467810 [Medicago truncatula]